MEKVNFKSLIEEVRFNSFVNSLLKMNEEQITVIASQLDEETRTRVISVLEASFLPKKVKVNVPDAKADAEAKVNQQVIDIIQNAGAKPSDELNPPASRPVKGKLDPDSLRAKYAKGPVKDPTEAGKGQPAADLKAGDMRSQFAKGPPTDAGVAKADASFKDTSAKIGARRAAEKSASAINYPKSSMGNMKAKADAAADSAGAINYPKSNMGNIKAKADAAADANVAKADASFKDTSAKIGARRAAEKSASAINYPKSSMGDIKAKADTDVRTKARTDAEVKAKRDATMSDTVKKVTKGLAGAGALGAMAVGLSKSTGDSSTAASAEPAGTKMKVAKGDTLSQIAQKNKVSVADLMKANQGIKNVHKIGVGQEIVVPKATNAPVYQGGIGTKAGPSMSQNIQKPKTVREENENSLIRAFLKIQASGSPNLFEAAKKAKKDWDKDGKIESEKDEVWGSRFRAAGIQKEESEAEKAKKNPMSHERDTASSRIPNRELTADEMPKKKVSKVVQTGKNTSTAYKVDEEVEISEARESFTKGTRKIKSYAQGDYHAEVRHNPDWQEYQVHFYKNGKHMGEGPVSYHGEDKEDAHDSAKAGLEFLNKRNNMAESVSFSDAELEHLYSIAEANPIAPVPDDYSGAAGGVSIRDLSDETVAEGIRGMRRKDSKFKDDPKRYTNEYPKSFREPGTMSKAEMRDHIEASVRRYLRSGGKIKKS